MKNPIYIIVLAFFRINTLLTIVVLVLANIAGDFNELQNGAMLIYLILSITGMVQYKKLRDENAKLVDEINEILDE